MYNINLENSLIPSRPKLGLRKGYEKAFSRLKRKIIKTFQMQLENIEFPLIFSKFFSE